jgi:hypothetical protein
MTQGQTFGNLELLDETIVDIAEATQYFPVKISKPSIERYIRQGKRGVRLESILLVNQRFTSVEAIGRFVRRQLSPELDAS